MDKKAAALQARSAVATIGPNRLLVVLLTAAVASFGVPFAGCGRDATVAPRSAPSVQAATPDASSVPQPISEAPQSSVEVAPTSTTSTDETSAEAAAAVLRAYYDAIAARRYEAAYRLWWNGGRASGQTFDQFRNGFGETRTVEATVGPPGPVEGAAGSRYVDVPITVRARTRRGDSQCFTGSYTLRRSEVEGAAEEQRRWRMYSASLRRCARR